MERRKFIKNSSLFVAGAAVGPAFLNYACAKEPILPESSFNGKIIIIGAGAAGMYAAYHLQKGGHDFQIIEAAAETGGRLGKIEGFADYPLDKGAQWLHGKKSVAGDLAKLKDVVFNKDKSDARFWFNNEIIKDLPNDPTAVLYDVNAPDVSFEQYSNDKGFGEEYKYIIEGLAGDSGADAGNLSVKWNSREEEEWSSGNSDYKFEKTFYDLLGDHILPSIQSKIKLNAIVSDIDYQSDQITVTDTIGGTYVCDKVIVTVPLPILQDGDITFSPALSTEKTEAFSKIGMDAGMKVFLKFSSKFYDGNIAGGALCAAYADESEGKNGNDNVLLAFVMGEQAQVLTDLGSDEAIASALLVELDLMYDGQASSNFTEAHIEDWTSNPFVRGAYSYSKVGIGDARSKAASSVQDKIFFAGECMNLNGHHQTVHGAMESGFNAVSKILKQYP
ncbi:MAG: monoamine oxidase [Arenicella sp.]|jgi:monoamine oxidase